MLEEQSHTMVLTPQNLCITILEGLTPIDTVLMMITTVETIRQIIECDMGLILGDYIIWIRIEQGGHITE